MESLIFVAGVAAVTVSWGLEQWLMAIEKGEVWLDG